MSLEDCEYYPSNENVFCDVRNKSHVGKAVLEGAVGGWNTWKIVDPNRS